MLPMFRYERGSCTIKRQSRKPSLPIVHCLAVLLSVASVALTGCGIGAVDNSVAPTPVAGVKLQGRVHGGNFPVTGSTITLVGAGVNGVASVGNGGYGTGSASIMNSSTPTVTTDGSGSFTITGDYTCPDPTTPVFITAFGGNPGLAVTPPATTLSNPQLLLMAALGPCGNLSSSTFININEVTTVASAYALAPFASINRSGNGILVGTSNTNVTGLTNAMATVNNLVNISTGAALSITPYYGGGKAIGTGTQAVPIGSGGLQPQPTTPVPFLNSSTAPQARLNTLANTLVGCVNTTGIPNGAVDGTPAAGSCGQLFSDATPPTSAVNAGVAPVDTLQAALDIALNPGNNVGALVTDASGAASFFQPSLSSAPNDLLLALTYTGGGLGLPAGNLEVNNNALVIDANGNIFVDAATSDNPATAKMVAEFNNFGEPLTKPTTVDPTTQMATYGGFQASGLPGPTGGSPYSMAIDLNGNIWLPQAEAANGVTEVTTASGLTASVVPTTNGISGAIVDANNNVWLIGGDLEVISGPAAPLQYLTNAGPLGPGSQAFDSNGNLWFQNYSTGALIAYNVTGIGAAAGTQIVNSTSNDGVNLNVVADNQGNVYGCNLDNDGMDVWNATSATPNNAVHEYSIGCGGYYGVIDGLANIWMQSPSGNSLVEMTNTGTVLSPAGGYRGSGATVTGGGTEPVTILGGSEAFDGSGNLWLSSYNTNGGTGNVLTEFVGIGGPVLTPVAAALAGGQLATRP